MTHYPGPSYEAMMEGAQQQKDQALHEPNGLSYFSHINEAVTDTDNLQIVLRTDDQNFDDVAVRAWWSYGKYDWQDTESEYKSRLVFEIPDEVTRRLQQQRAQQIMSRFFGIRSDIALEEPVLADDTDKDRKDFDQWAPGTVVHKEIIDRWSEVKEAIDATDQDAGSMLGGQQLRLRSAAGTTPSLARVNEDRFELYIPPKAVTKIQDLWGAAFKRSLVQSSGD